MQMPPVSQDKSCHWLEMTHLFFFYQHCRVKTLSDEGSDLKPTDPHLGSLNKPEICNPMRCESNYNFIMGSIRLQDEKQTFLKRSFFNRIFKHKKSDLSHCRDRFGLEISLLVVAKLCSQNAVASMLAWNTSSSETQYWEIRAAMTSSSTTCVHFDFIKFCSVIGSVMSVASVLHTSRH